MAVASESPALNSSRLSRRSRHGKEGNDWPTGRGRPLDNGDRGEAFSGMGGPFERRSVAAPVWLLQETSLHPSIVKGTASGKGMRVPCRFVIDRIIVMDSRQVRKISPTGGHRADIMGLDPI